MVSQLRKNLCNVLGLSFKPFSQSSAFSARKIGWDCELPIVKNCTLSLATGQSSFCFCRRTSSALIAELSSRYCRRTARSYRGSPPYFPGGLTSAALTAGSSEFAFEMVPRTGHQLSRPSTSKEDATRTLLQAVYSGTLNKLLLPPPSLSHPSYSHQHTNQKQPSGKD